VKDNAAADGKALTDKELDCVAGGADCVLGFLIWVLTPG
jgi:hypothetical protein